MACFTLAEQVSLDAGDNVEVDLPVGRAIQPIEPAPKSAVTDTTPTFHWRSIAGANEYEVSLGTAHLMEWVYVGPDTTFTLADSLAISPGNWARWTVTAWRRVSERSRDYLGEFEGIATFSVE